MPPRPTHDPRAPRPHHRPALPCQADIPTGADLLTDRQQQRPKQHLFASDDYAEVEATWGIYQRLVGAHRNPDRTHGKTGLTAVIDALTRRRAPRTDRAPLTRTLAKRSADVLAHSDRPGTSSGPTEAINGRRTPPRIRPRLPQPHPLHRPINAREPVASAPNYTVHCEKAQNYGEVH